jgi:hypothetical protein
MVFLKVDFCLVIVLNIFHKFIIYIWIKCIEIFNFLLVFHVFIYIIYYIKKRILYFMFFTDFLNFLRMDYILICMTFYLYIVNDENIA